MGQIVQLSEARARKVRTRTVERGAAEPAAKAARAFEAVEHGSGWYHGEAIRASKEPFPRPH